MTRRTAPARAVGPLAALILLAGCGMPMPDGVRAAGSGSAGEGQRGAVTVLPPGPRPDAGPLEVVQGFLAAQASSRDRHAVARRFLTPEARRDWDDTFGVVVYEGAPQVEVDEANPSRATVRLQMIGRVLRDGSYVVERESVEETGYRLVRRGASWALAAVPAGLRLSATDRDRSFQRFDTWFPAPAAGQVSRTPRLVADPVFVGVEPSASVAETAQALLERLLDGPSPALERAVVTAVPEGVGLRRRVSVSDGTVVVDLDRSVQELPPAAREPLSAQLVWTLRGLGTSFGRLRLLAGGRPLEVPGRGPLQDRADWADYDPDGLAPRVPAVYVEGRRLASLDGGVTTSPATDGTLPVDEVAVSPSTQLALLTDVRGGRVLRIGPAGGPFDARTGVRRGLASPSWGSGEEGLWLLDAGRLLLFPVAGQDADAAAPAAPPREVPVEGLAPGTRPTSLRVSRDGARVALVVDGRLLVGSVERDAQRRLRVAGLRAVAPGLTALRDVAWETSSSLVVLASSGRFGWQPYQVAVDGAEVQALARLGAPGDLRSVAAAEGRPLVVGAVVQGRPTLLRDDGRALTPVAAGRFPAYPG